MANAFPSAVIHAILIAYKPAINIRLRSPPLMAKPHHKVKKANHGKRPASAKAKKAKRKLIRT
jgi:hypothetical protein